MSDIAKLIMYLLKNNYNFIMIGIGLLYLFPLLAFGYTIAYIRKALEKNTQAINALVALIIDDKADTVTKSELEEIIEAREG